MIIRGRSRGRPAELAQHVLRVDTNERVEVVQITGTVADDVLGAFREMTAVAAGTSCKKALYHASINTRVSEHLSVEQWLFAVDQLEAKLGLKGQPRVVVQHLKAAREHLHVVWGRIDPERMCAIADSHNYRAHEEAARGLERVFGHARVQGAHAERDGHPRPQRTPYLDELQQAARTGIDLARMTEELTESWRRTDSAEQFSVALEQRGYKLARGDRRQYVVLDAEGGVHSLARRIEGARVATIRERFASQLAALPTIAEARAAQQKAQYAARLQTTADGQQLRDFVEPRTVFENLLRTRSYVTGEEIKRALEDESVKSPETALEKIIGQEDVLRLHHMNTGETVGYTTKSVRVEDLETVTLARKMSEKQSRRSSSSVTEAVIAESELDAEQADAVRYALAGRQLALITGRAGVGKSRVLQTLRLIAEAEGRPPAIALGPTNTVVQDLRDAGFQRAATVHSLLWHRENAPRHKNAQIPAGSLIVVDEAAALDTRRLRQLLQAVPPSATVVMVGDERQLGSVERGGIYADLISEFGSAKLTTVRRQERHWAKAASRAFSEYRFLDGLEALSERGLIHWSPAIQDSRTALLTRYEEDTRAGKGKGKRFIFAYTNEECRRLNDAVQDMEIGRGRVKNLHVFETERGTLRVGEGDRIMFRANDKPRGILNGALARIEKIEGDTLIARTDRGRRIAFGIREFSNLDLGYAGTIHRGQGKNLDHVYLLHTRHWRDAASYVALTRSRHTTQVFVARAQARDTFELARQMTRQGQRGSTLQFLTAAELQQQRDAIAPNISQLASVASTRRRDGRSVRRRQATRSADREQEL